MKLNTKPLKFNKMWARFGQGQGQVRVRLGLVQDRVRIGLGFGQGQVKVRVRLGLVQDRVRIGLGLGQVQVRVRLRLGQVQVRVRSGLGQGKVWVRLVKGNVFKFFKIPSNAGYNSQYSIIGTVNYKTSFSEIASKFQVKM